MKKRSVLIIYTGGTIGMVRDYENNSLRAFEFDKLLEQIPELNKFNLDLKCASLEKPIDSSNMNSEIWGELLKIIENSYDDVDGFVILHGTDTMAYTASALSFMVTNLRKPIIFTGSQLPIDTIRTDGKENMITAIEIASAYFRGKARVPEIAILLESSLHRANRCTKYSAEHFDAFKSPNFPLLAEANAEIEYNNFAIDRQHDGKISFNYKMSGDISVLKLYPGISKSIVKNVLSDKNAKAFIIETFGAGNAMTDDWFIDLVKKVIDRGVPVVNSSQCPQGSVKQGLYQTSEKLKEIGVISGGDMTFEATITKLMHLLSRFTAMTSIKREMESSIKGERTIEEIDFICVENELEFN